jgi:hypothetical protein
MFLGLILVVIAYLLWMHRFADKNYRLPPLNSSEGKQARLIGVPILLLMLVYMFYHSKNNHTDLRIVITALIASAIYAIIIYGKNKHR